MNRRELILAAVKKLGFKTVRALPSGWTKLSIPADKRDLVVSPVSDKDYMWIDTRGDITIGVRKAPGLFRRQVDASFMNLLSRELETPPESQGATKEADSCVRTIQKVVDNGVTIQVVDAPGQGGASHVYGVRVGSTPLFTVSFQNGPIKEFGTNGCQQEDLLAIVIDRLTSFQAGPFACRENAAALQHVQEALMWLDNRTLARRARNVV